MDLHKQIINSNLKVHKIEAPFYDRLHGEIFNWYEQHRINREIHQVFALCSGNTALDLGCGTGNITLKLIKKGYQVIAIDLSQSMLDILKGKLHKKANNEATLICGDISALISSVANTYSIITISSVLHHLPDYLATLEKIASLLNAHGVLYITHEPSGFNVKSTFFRKMLYFIDSGIWYSILGKRRLSIPDIDYSFSDYHIKHGFDSNLVIKCLYNNNLMIRRLNYYSATAKMGITSLIDNLIFNAETHFSVIAIKR